MLPYDKSIKVGDIVTGYYKGYWKVTDVQDRKDHPPILVAELVLNTAGQKTKRSVKSWDASYSSKITKASVEKMITDEQAAFELKKANLLNLL